MVRPDTTITVPPSALTPSSQAPLTAGDPPAKDDGKKEDDKKGVVRIVSISVDKLKELVNTEVHKERKKVLDKAYGLGTGTDISGGGVFSAKILTEKEVDADPAKKGAREAAAAKGEKIVFLRTNTKAQLFGSHSFPIGTPGDVGVRGGLRLGGVIEIVETRAIPKEWAGAWEHVKDRVFLWPLSSKHLSEDMRVGEDITITGRIERGSAVSAGLGQRLGDWVFGSVGYGGSVSTGKAADDWITLRITKIDDEHVRLFLQKGNGEVMSANLSVSAGLDLYDNEFIPSVTPETIDDGFVGKAVLGGKKSVLRELEKLASTELSGGWSRGKHDAQTEGWGSVSLTDEKSASALDDFFRFKPQALRALPPEATLAKTLGAGRLDAQVQDVTHDKNLQARLSLLKATKTKGTAFYEIHWKLDDGTLKRYLVGVEHEGFKGDLTDTARSEQSVMWYDLDTGSSAVSVQLGPQKRLFTTTREKINDVIATQKALNLPVEGKIDHPHPYLQLFGLGNYGRSVEEGRFVLPSEGVQALKKATRSELITAYLRADWIYEKESFAPGKWWGSHSKAPPWAEVTDPAGMKPVLEFLHDHAAEAMRLQGDKDERQKLDWLDRDYQRVAPGRSLISDAWVYVDAADYANYVGEMQRSEDPAQLIELFTKLRSDGDVELKRSVAATAMLSRGHYSAYIEMTGKRVSLKPLAGQLELPQNPLGQVNGLFGSWR